MPDINLKEPKIWTIEALCTFYKSFPEILKDSGIKDDKFIEYLGMTGPTWRRRKAKPICFSVEELEIISKLLSNRFCDYPVSSLVEFIRTKHTS